jgi:hypothetical protein
MPNTGVCKRCTTPFVAVATVPPSYERIALSQNLGDRFDRFVAFFVN